MASSWSLVEWEERERLSGNSASRLTAHTLHERPRTNDERPITLQLAGEKHGAGQQPGAFQLSHPPDRLSGW